jgi:Peroxisomal membrane protein (Pex16)
VRLSILRTSGCRILSNGGATTFDPVMGSGSGGGGHNNGFGGGGGNCKEPGSEARAREVFTAFAAFRDKHCFAPLNRRINQQEKQQDPGLRTENGGKNESPLWWDQDEATRDIKSSAPNINAGLSITEDSQYQLNDVPQQAPLNSMQALKTLEYQTSVRQAAAYRLIILGELIHILRPLLYVAALRRWGRRSWKPWTLSLALEVGSNRLTAAGAAASHRAAAEAARSSAVSGTALAALYGMQGIQWRREELDEITRRKLQLLLGLLRDPFFSTITGPAVERWEKRLQRVPVVGRLSSKVVELLLGIQKYYTYTSGS